MYYVYVAEKFDASETNNPTSNPKEIYERWWQIFEDFTTLNPSLKYRFDQYINGIRERAREDRNAGILAEDDFQKILGRLGKRIASDYQPRLFLIPITANIQERLRSVAEDLKPNQESIEYIIPDLSATEFDSINGLV